MSRLIVWLIRVILLSSIALAAYAAEVKFNEGEFLKTRDLSQYIESRNYPAIKIDDNYGELLTESLVGSYSLASLRELYYQKACAGVYLINCKRNLQNLAQYAKIDLTKESALLGVPFKQINAYKVIYTTPDLNNQIRRVSGAVLVPQTEAELKGVIVFYHFTVLNRNNAPSSFDHDEYNLSKLTAASLASAGYVVLLPDYLGLGVDKDNVHPYILSPQINALSGIYMLKLLAKIEPTLVYRKLNQAIPLYLSGYSEGAAYSLWASKILNENADFLQKYGFNLEKTLPIDGVYNLSKVTLPFLLDDQARVEHTAPYYTQDQRIADFVRPGLVANVLYSYAHFNSPESREFSAKFNDCVGCTFAKQEYSSLNDLMGANLTDFVKYRLIYNAALNAGYGGANSSLNALARDGLLQSKEFQDTLLAADIYNWQASTPISLFSLEYDSIAPRLNSETAYQALAKQGSKWVNLWLIPNQNFKVKSYFPFNDMTIDHAHAVPFMLLFVRKELNASD